jgi:hypothetical protein
MVTPEYIADTIMLTLEQHQAKYKQKGDSSKPKIKDQRSLDNLRRQYRKQLLKMESMPHNPENPELDQLEKVRELLESAGISPEQIGKIHKVSLWQGLRNNGEETEVVDLASVSFSPKDVEELSERYTPIEPAVINPTTKERPERSSKLILVYGDGQVDYRRRIDPVTDEMELIPLHDVAMHNVIKQLNSDLMPETTVNLGDFCDAAALSRFDPDSDHFHKTLGPSLRYIHDFYAQMRADNPEAEHVEVDSNHAARPKRAVLKNLPALYDFVIPGEDYPMLSYYRMANLGKVGLRFISGYGGAEFIYGEEYGNPIVFKHGNHSSSTLGATARKEAAENPTVNVVRGHGHGDEEVRQTTRDGRQLFYKMLGSSCLNNGPVPGYNSAIDDHNRPVEYHNRKHVNTLMIIEDFMNGHYTSTTVDVVNGKAYYEGREYDGNE